MYIGTINILKVQWSSVGATTRITCPNNTRRVVWALGEVFSLFVYLYSLLYIGTSDSFNLWRGSLEAWRGFFEGNNNDKGPRWCKMHPLGPRWVFFLFLRVFFLLKDVYRYYVCYDGYRWANGRQRQRKQAQMMHIMSFGPLVSNFLLFVLFFNSY